MDAGEEGGRPVSVGGARLTARGSLRVLWIRAALAGAQTGRRPDGPPLFLPAVFCRRSLGRPVSAPRSAGSAQAVGWREGGGRGSLGRPEPAERDWALPREDAELNFHEVTSLGSGNRNMRIFYF